MQKLLHKNIVFLSKIGLIKKTAVNCRSLKSHLYYMDHLDHQLRRLCLSYSLLICLYHKKLCILRLIIVQKAKQTYYALLCIGQHHFCTFVFYNFARINLCITNGVHGVQSDYKGPAILF